MLHLLFKVVYEFILLQYKPENYIIFIELYIWLLHNFINTKALVSINLLLVLRQTIIFLVFKLYAEQIIYRLCSRLILISI